MADAPEIPEAKDPFEKRVALTIAILAICLSFIGNLGDNAKTDAGIKTTEASNQWGYFQAKSIKGQMSALHGDLITRFGSSAGGALSEEARATAARLAQEAERYEAERVAIKAKAEELQKEADRKGAVNDRCDHSALLLQIGIVVCSVAILAGARSFWWAGIALGIAGIALGTAAFLM
jgi:hypothetical protein